MVKNQDNSGNGAPPNDAASKRFEGTWEGTMMAPGSYEFPVAIVIQKFKFGKWSGTIQHDDPLNAAGRLLGISLEEDTMIVAQTIIQGRQRCLDGLNLLMLVDNETMHRIWVDPATGVGRDKGVLKRQ